jgi:hypothetical protein
MSHHNIPMNQYSTVALQVPQTHNHPMADCFAEQ